MNDDLPEYWKNPYLSEIETEIVFVSDDFIGLKHDIFYPESGGQESDTGFLFVGDKLVGEVYHVIKGENEKSLLKVSWIEGFEPKVGQIVKAKIDFDRRISLMRAHTGQHLLSAVLLNMKGFDTIRAEIHPDEFIVETNELIKKQDLLDVINQANRLILNGNEVKIHYYGSEEIESIKGTRKPLKKAGKKVRVVEITNVDKTFCGGTHVKNLNEIGFLDVISYGKRYLQVITGEKTIQSLSNSMDLKIDVSKKLTTSVNQAIYNLFEQFEKTNKELKNKEKITLDFLNSIISYSKSSFLQNLKGIDVFVFPLLPFGKKHVGKIIKILKENDVHNFIFPTMDNFVIIEIQEEPVSAEKIKNKLVSTFNAKGGGKKGKYTLKLEKNIEYHKLLSILNDF